MKSSEKTQFEKSLSVPKATEMQTKIATEQIKSIAFREMAKFDFEKNEKLGLQDLAQKVAEQCNISDISRISDMIELWLNTENVILKVNRENIYRKKADNSENYEIFEVKNIVKQPSKEYVMQAEWQKEENRKANEILQKFVDKAQKIMETLPKSKRYNVKAIKSEFSASDLEKNPMWIELAIEKAIQIQKLATKQK